MTFTDRALVTGIDPDVSAALAIYERIKPLKQSLGIDNLTDGELQVFAYVARFTGLDPFTKQIYAIKRGGRVTHQTGIDGYRSVAERSGQYAGSEEATYEDCDCGKDDSPPQHPRLARVIARRILSSGHIVEQVGVARWHELKPAHVKPQGANDYLDAMWWRQPYNQLAKCAEANGLRKAFPRVLGGVYIAEEMQGPETVDGEYHEVQAPPRATVAERIAARRAQALPAPDGIGQAVATGPLVASGDTPNPAPTDAAGGMAGAAAAIDPAASPEPGAGIGGRASGSTMRETSTSVTSSPETATGGAGPSGPDVSRSSTAPEKETVRSSAPLPVAAETVAGATGAAPAAALCGKPGPYSEGETCDLVKGHRGPHKNFEDNATWL